MKHNLILFIILITLQTITTSSLAATSQVKTIEETTIPSTKVPIKERFFQKRVGKKLKKWISKWESQSKHTEGDRSDDIGTWTWISIGLIAASLLFPPLIFGALVTSIIALVKNKKEENLGDLDKVLALTALIIAIIGAIVVGLVILLYGAILFAGLLGV